MWTPRVGGTNDFYLFVLIEIQQEDFTQRIEIVGRTRQHPPLGVFEFHVRYELPVALAPLALQRSPRGPVVASPIAIGTLPEIRIADGDSSGHSKDMVRSGGMVSGDLGFPGRKWDRRDGGLARRRGRRARPRLAGP